ncbi:MAG TPA: HpcH/HpaI aldolase/citrate lyase family protein [Burkholderiales bacterium]|jgi:4-hydroxy-2-oxoheptanedioate aldolase
MDIPVNQFKRNLAAGKAQIGLWMSSYAHQIVELCAPSGFDWLLLDTEHAPNDPHMVHTQLMAAKGGTAHCVVRPAWNDLVLIKRFLDIGAQTLLLPYVQTAEEAHAAVQATRFPPEGLRGVASSTRAAGYGRIKNYLKEANKEICVLVQVETRKSLDNLDEICKVDGVDGVFIGPNDLAGGLGHLGDIPHPEVQSAIADAIKRIRALGKAPGILVGEADGQRMLDLGAQFVAVGADTGLLRVAADNLAAKFKK